MLDERSAADLLGVSVAEFRRRVELGDYPVSRVDADGRHWWAVRSLTSRVQPLPETCERR
jgi:hypothetical protein